MEHHKVIYFVYSGEEIRQPLSPGSAHYARVYETEYSVEDYWWNTDTDTWERNDYLGHLAATGSPDLDNVAEANLPPVVTRF